MNGTLSKQELKEYADGARTEIFVKRVFDEHVHHGKTAAGNNQEMDFESFLDFVLALENKDTPEGLTYLFVVLILMVGDSSQQQIFILFSEMNASRFCHIINLY